MSYERYMELVSETVIVACLLALLVRVTIYCIFKK